MIDDQTQAYLHSQIEEVQAMNRERTRQTDQYLNGLWSQYRTIICFLVPILLFSGCGIAYHHFTLHKLSDIQQELKDQRYQDLQQSIEELKQQEKGSDYKETCNTFLGMQRCTREVK